MISELTEGAKTIGADDAVRVIVLRGEGRHFQAGADLAWIDGLRGLSPEDSIAVSQRTTDAVYSLMTLPKPAIALIHGGCFGGGTGVAAACDIVIADETAIFSITEARWGLTAIPIVPQLLSRIGPGRLRRYSLTCERFDARRAFEIGLADEVCAPGALDQTAAPIIDALLHCPPGSLAETKSAALKYAGLLYDAEARAGLARPHGLKRLDDEAGEGLQSFLEKRKPAWYPGAAG
jgi:methylglutaconyl-CoA hydratase